MTICQDCQKAEATGAFVEGNKIVAVVCSVCGAKRDAIRRRAEIHVAAPAPIVCPRCGVSDDECVYGPMIDHVGDGEHVLCMRCGLCWPPGGHVQESWPCLVCMGSDPNKLVDVSTDQIVDELVRRGWRRDEIRDGQKFVSNLSPATIIWKLGALT